jgi:hypothetical protein
MLLRHVQPQESSPCILRVYCHCGISQHGLRARGSHHNLAAAILQWVRKAGQHTKLNRLQSKRCSRSKGCTTYQHT